MSEFLATCGNPGRGAHYFALQAARRIFDARESIADSLGIKQSERLVFTPGCTASLNMVLRGLVLEGRLGKGDVVIVSSLEHNSVMRPLAQLQEAVGVSYVVCPVGENFVDDLKSLVEKHKPKLVALTWASNVTGEVLPIKEIALYLRDRGVPLLVDGAQTAGKLDADLWDSGVSFYCTSGHKGLMGAPGVGLLYVAPEYSLSPIVAGGTGSRSESLELPTAFPDRLEAGTLPGPAIAALAAGVEWLKQIGADRVVQAELALTNRFLEWAEQQNYIRVYGPARGAEERMPVVSLSMHGVAPSTVAHLLDTEDGIAVRSGLHCAAICHRSLGTLEHGLVRVSFGHANTQHEVDALCSALERIARRAVQAC